MGESSKSLRAMSTLRRSLALAVCALLSGLLSSGLTVSGAETAAPAKPKSGRGFFYHHDEVPAMPWSIHVVRVDRSNPDLELHTTLGKGTTLGLSTLSEQIRGLPADLGRPVAAINGDFWNEDTPIEGDPKGLQVSEGELISGPCERACFWLDAQGAPHLTNVLSKFSVTWPAGETASFGLNEKLTNNGAVLYTPTTGTQAQIGKGLKYILERSNENRWLPLKLGQTLSARVRELSEDDSLPVIRDRMILALSPAVAVRLPKLKAGDVVTFSTATFPDLTGVKTALGGGPTLVHQGAPMHWNTPPPRHPRSAIGWNDQYLFLVEVDGRQAGLSVGMSFPELADYLVRLGCQEALNLDGGGSSTLWVLGQVMNSPCYGHERNMANALLLVRKDKAQQD